MSGRPFKLAALAAATRERYRPTVSEVPCAYDVMEMELRKAVLIGKFPFNLTVPHIARDVDERDFIDLLAHEATDTHYFVAVRCRYASKMATFQYYVIDLVERPPAPDPEPEPEPGARVALPAAAAPRAQ